jgi:hypothetical protein
MSRWNWQMGSDPRPSCAVCATMYSQVQPTHMAERRPIGGSWPFTGLYPNRSQTIRGSELIGSLNESDGLPINLDSFTRKVIQPVLQANRIPWYGWQAFRRSLASNLYATGAQDILVQRILRHAKAHVTRDCYIKVFDSTVSSAMHRLQVQFEQLEESKKVGSWSSNLLSALTSGSLLLKAKRVAVFQISLAGSGNLNSLLHHLKQSYECAAKEQRSTRAVVLSCSKQTSERWQSG